MFAIKKYAQQKLTFLHFAGAFLLLISCGNHSSEETDPTLATVIFCNDSSYEVKIHQTNFSGIILAELKPAHCLSTNVSPSNNSGIGTVFSIEYWHLLESGIWVGGIDPERQITQNLEAGGSYIISIPQPSNLDVHESFIKIFNASVINLELNCLSMALRPINKELFVPSGGSGLYNVNDIKNSSCFSDDGEIKNLAVKKQDSTFLFDPFTIDNGYIYNFEFDGKEVIQTEKEKIIQQ